MASVAKRKWTHKGTAKEAWAVRYFDEKGVRRSKTFNQKKDADTFKRKVEREIEDGTHMPDTETLTISRVAEQFLAYTHQRRRDGRIGRSRYSKLHHSIERHLIPQLGRMPINRVQMIDVERLFNAMVATGKIKAVTAREKIFDMKLLQDFAIKRKWLKTRPFDEALSELTGIKKGRIRVPTPEEVRRLMDVAATRKFNGTARSQARIECMLHIAAFCGLRQGEQLGLKLSLVDFDRRLIKVRHSLLWDNTLKGPKTAAGVRDVPMPAHVVEMLRAYVDRFYVDNERNPHGLIFRTQKGCHFDVATLHKQWHDLIERAGIDESREPLRWHSLRHFCASWMIQHGLPVTEVARLLGHNHFDTTLQIYSHAVMNETSRHEAIDRMAGALPALTDARVTHSALSA